MLAPVYSATQLQWFPMELKRAYSNDNCRLPMPLPWCYIAHVCWVFCVLSFGDGENWLAPGGGHGCRLKEGGGRVWEMDTCDRTYVLSSLSAFFFFSMLYTL